jgi:phage terminase small subunit
LYAAHNQLKEAGVKPRGNLTTRQRKFAELVVEGIFSNAECARRAGFAKKAAATYADKLLNGVDYPHVAALVEEMREERRRRYGVTLDGQLKRLYDLSRGAEEAGQFAAAINSEKIRSSLGGLTVDRRETINSLDQMSRDEITARLTALQQKYPAAFQLEDKTPVMRDVTPPVEDAEVLEDKGSA